MSNDTVETKAAVAALAALATKYPKEYARLYAQAAHPQSNGVLPEQRTPLTDKDGRELSIGLRVRRPDGVLGEIIRLNLTRRAAVVVGDDGSERFVMAHRLKVTSRKAPATAA